MNRQTLGFVALSAVVSFLLGLVAAGTRPGKATEVLPVRPGAEIAKPITIATDPAGPVGSQGPVASSTEGARRARPSEVVTVHSPSPATTDATAVPSQQSTPSLPRAAATRSRATPLGSA